MSAISDDAAYDYTSESQPMAVEYRREDWSVSVRQTVLFQKIFGVVNSGA
jgi:hypothetical protein